MISNPDDLAYIQSGDVSQLASFIAENMPSGNSAACGTDCGNAVASYIATNFWEDNGPLVCNDVNYGARQLKILLRDEYQRSIEDLLGVDFNAAIGLAEDGKVGPFSNNTQRSVVASSYDAYLAVAEAVAAWSAERDFSPALSCVSFNQDCAGQLINDFLPKAFRRPLENIEITRYTTLANGSLTEGDVKEGIHLAIEAMLSSPQFIYRHEIGELNPSNGLIDTDAYELSSYEMATWLSYNLTGSTPDAILMQKAANDELRDDSAILLEARRLLATDGAKRLMGDFVGAWLDTDNMSNALKAEWAWPEYEQISPYLSQEIREVFAHVMLDSDERFSSLYDADYTYVNETLAAHYGINGVTGEDFQKVTTTDRGGIIANGAFMSRWSEDVETSPIRRSVRVRRRMLCQDQPLPPAGIAIGREQAIEENAEILRDPDTTNRLKYHTITSNEDCQACHREWINPLGFGMEDFNPVGNPRTTDLRGNLIDASGQLYAANSLNDKFNAVPFEGTLGLGALVATLPSAQACISKTMFRFMVGVSSDAVDSAIPGGSALDPQEKNGYACEIDDLTNTMMTTSPREMLESMGAMPAVRFRKEWTR